MDIKEVGIPLEVLPENLRAILAPDAAEKRKMVIARAAIPMAPDILLPALAYLTNEKNAELRNAARKSLDELPRGNVLPVLRSAATAGPILDRLARVYMQEDECIQQILLNRSTPDDTFVYVARYGEGRPLDAIALNQERLSRSPAIVQGIYYNPKAKMSTVALVMEYAVRENLPIQHMPGYKEIVAAVYGDAKLERPAEEAEAEAEAADQAKQEAAAAAETVEKSPQAPVTEVPAERSLSAEELLEQAFGDEDVHEDDDDIEMFQSDSDLMDELMGDRGVAEDDEFGDFLGEGSSPGLEDESDDAFFAVLSAAMQDDGSEGDEDKESAFIADRIKNMNISEKVRVALMGNGSARDVLIRDANKLVSSAVMRNPGVTDREVLDYASNKNLSTDVLRLIATGRTWTRNYTVKKALIVNPKTPPACAMGFLKHLRDKDLKDVAKNRDISPTITRIAKRIISERMKKK
jgi:hypothetical protein